MATTDETLAGTARLRGRPELAPDGTLRVRARHWLWAALAGVTTGAAFEPVAVTYLAPLGVAGLLVLVRGVASRRAAEVGFVFGTAYLGFVLFWLVGSIGIGAWMAVTLLQAIWFAALAVGLSRAFRGRAWPLWSALLWTVAELGRSSLPFGGLPWGRLGFSVVDSPWASSLAYAGVTGVGLALALTGTSLAWVVMAGPGGKRLPGSVALGVVLLATGLAVAFPVDVPTSGEVRVALVQGGVPGDGTEVARNSRQVSSNHVTATTALGRQVDGGEVGRPDFVLWPENSTAVDPLEDVEIGGGIRAAVAAVRVPVLIGAVAEGPTAETTRNQGIVWTADGDQDRYTKRHLVPFGEYIPLRPWLGGLSSRLDAIPRDMTPGDSIEPLRIAGLRVADAICFDVAYDDVIAPQVRRGAELVTVQTSNAMFVGTSQLEQQFAITRARAIESGRAVVVASVNGVSGVIGPDGEVVARVPVLESRVLVAEVPTSTALTPAVLLGPWPARLVVALVGGWLLVGGLRWGNRLRRRLAVT